MGPGVGALVAALANQPGRCASAPTDITLDGCTGKYVEFTAFTVDFADCDGGAPRSWGERSYDPGMGEQLWILDIDGDRLVIAAAFIPEATARDAPSFARSWSPSVSIDWVAAARHYICSSALGEGRPGGAMQKDRWEKLVSEGRSLRTATRSGESDPGQMRSENIDPEARV